MAEVSELPRGISKIKYGDGFLYLGYVDRGASQTVISFHAAVGTVDVTKPVFTGINMLGNLQVNQIYVSDPILDKGLNLGWFAGEKGRDLQKDLTSLLLRHFESRPRETGPIFFGASGGGFAALYYSAMFGDSLAMCVNPQTDIGQYWEGAVDSYLDAAWEGAGIDSLPITTDLTSVYQQELGSTVFYLQNLGDVFHVNKHLIPLLENTTLPNRQFGLVLGEWGNGHRAPQRAILDHYLNMAINARGEWVNLTFSREVENRVEVSEVMRRSNEYSRKI